MNNIERGRNVRYELYSSTYGRAVVQSPQGWNEDSKNFTRDSDSRGIVSKISVNLQFFGNGATYISNVYYNFGIEEKVLLTKYEKNKYSINEEWNIRYIQQLDLSTFKEDSRTKGVTIEATEGGLYSDIKNRISDEYDLLENLSADEVDIGILTTSKFQPLGRKIFVQSLLEDAREGFQVKGKNTGNTSTNTRAIPLKVIYNSDKDDITLPISGAENNDPLQDQSSYQQIENSSDIADQFLFQAEQNKVVSIDFTSSLKLTKIETGSVRSSDFTVELRKSADDVNGEFKIVETTTLLSVPTFSVGDKFNINYSNDNITLQEGESLSIVVAVNIQLINLNSSQGTQNLFFTTDSKLVVEDKTAYEQLITISKCIKPLDLFDRIVAKITGKQGLVKSSLFGSGGEYEYMVVDNGLWARGFEDGYTDSSGDEQEIQLVTSFQDAFDSYNYIEPLCWFTEIIGTTEYVRIESAKHTQKNFIGISVGSVDNVKIESSKTDYFSSVSLGHENSLEYEEISGLDETNGKSEFSTFITKNESEYSVLSKYRVDAIGYELTRRKSYTFFPKTDNERDNDIWIHDAKKLSTGVITHKRWGDIFDAEPKGIYDPDSAWNLFLSPMNRLFYGHGYSIKRGLYHYPKKVIRFNSSNSNKNMITSINGFSLSESDNISISDIPSNKVEATEVSMSFKMTQQIEDLFKGKQEYQGEEVYNYFGLIEYIDNGVKKYGRLVSLENDEESKLTLIKARI